MNCDYDFAGLSIVRLNLAGSNLFECINERDKRFFLQQRQHLLSSYLFLTQSSNFFLFSSLSTLFATFIMHTRSSLRKGSKKHTSYALSSCPSSPTRKKQRSEYSFTTERAHSNPAQNSCIMESSADSQIPSEYWNHPELHTSAPNSERAFLSSTASDSFFNLDNFGTDIKVEIYSPTAGSAVNYENESEYSDDLTPTSNPFHNPFLCSQGDLTLCYAPNAGSTGYPIFVSRNRLRDWYHFPSDTTPTETPATSASGTIDEITEITKKMKSEFNEDLNILPSRFSSRKTTSPCALTPISGSVQATILPFPLKTGARNGCIFPLI